MRKGYLAPCINLAKVGVVGSNPIARSSYFKGLRAVGAGLLHIMSAEFPIF